MFAKIKERIRGVADVYRVLKKNWIVGLMLAGLTAVLSVLGQTAVTKVTQMLFPALDDTSQIINNQNKQFADIKDNLNDLASKLAGQDSEKLGTLRDAIKAAQASSEDMVTRLSQLVDENQHLRAVLKKEKGIEGGVDLLVPLNEGYKIDAATNIGFNGWNGAGAGLSLTSLNAAESVANKYVPVGTGIYFTNSAGKHCLLTLLGASSASGGSRPLAKFSMQCKN